ncbi:MAG: hypothetical protein ABJZ55_20345 [Fuerstiella sp.]
MGDGVEDDFFAVGVAEAEPVGSVDAAVAELPGVDPAGAEPTGAVPTKLSQSDDWLELYGGRVALDSQTADWVFFEVLTVPDLSRVVASVAAPVDFVRKDLSALEKLTAGEVKTLVTPALPDDQLLALHDFETRAGAKPRKVAIDALRIELNRRGAANCQTCGQPLDSWDQWIHSAAGDPYQCTVAAISLAMGGGDPQTRVVGRDGSESQLLEWFWSSMQRLGGGDGLGRLELANPDWVNQWRVIGVRSLFHDIENRSSQHFVPQGSRGSQAWGVDINRLAAAYGLNLAHVPGAASVMQAATDCQYSKVQTIANGRLEAGRAVMLAERSIS